MSCLLHANNGDNTQQKIDTSATLLIHGSADGTTKAELIFFSFFYERVSFTGRRNIHHFSKAETTKRGATARKRIFYKICLPLSRVRQVLKKMVKTFWF